jgi:hypothetical protein
MNPTTNTEAGAVADVAATIDSSVYGRAFYGILNKDGQFWTPLAFDSERKAHEHIAAFFTDIAMRGTAIRDFRIVPVRIQLTHLSEQGAMAS